VTALHVVAGCRTIQVYTAKHTDRSINDIRVTNADSKHDLALLRSPVDLGEAPLTLSTATAADEPLATTGYPYGARSPQSMSLEQRFVQGGTLGDVLGNEDTNKITAAGWPALDERVLNLEGHLVPGLSGSPIFNSLGRVVGVADGGLQQGYVAISWATFASYVNALPKDPKDPAVPLEAGELLFAYDNVAPNRHVTVKCPAGAVVDLVGSKTYLELQKETDDPQGLGVLTRGLQADISDEFFDVYQEQSSGAAFVLPHGLTLASEGDECVARDQGSTTFHIRFDKFNSDTEGETTALAFQTRVFGANPGWEIDPNFSYAVPKSRADGMLFFRRAYVHGALRSFNGAGFATFATLNKKIVSVIAVDPDVTGAVYTKAIGCIANGSSDGDCAESVKTWRRWADAVHGVALATFPQK
jgi:hypothetical protein